MPSLRSNRLPLRQRRVLRIGGAVACTLVLLWLIASFLVVHSLTRRHRSRFKEPLPRADGFVIQEHRLRTSDGEDLGLWHVPLESRRPTVILFHGNGGSRESCWPQAECLVRAGYPVVLVSCRAHGHSSGEFNDVGWSARRDVLAAVDWLRVRQPEGKIVLWGFSLGSAAAVFAAEDLKSQVSGYILECPYQDLPTAVWHRLQNNLPPVIDGACFLGLRLAALAILPNMHEISPVKHIRKIPSSVPVLILAGQSDRRARPEEARALHAQIHDHCQLELILRGDHLRLREVDPAAYDALVLKFLDEI